MAERAYETPQHFWEWVVRPNEIEFRKNSDSLRAAFNSIMSTDSLSGHMFFALRRVGATQFEEDREFRQELCQEDPHYEIIRDTAKALKHISLTQGKPLIKNASQTHVGQRPYGSGLFGIGKFSENEVLIELNDGEIKHCLSEVILSNQFLLHKIQELFG